MKGIFKASRNPAMAAAIVAAIASLAPGCGMIGDAGPMEDTYEYDATPDGMSDSPMPDVPGDTVAGPADWELNCEPCSSPPDCDDGLTCSGQEQCLYSQYRSEMCCYAEAVQCVTEDPCLVGACSEAIGGCSYSARDDDGDGHSPTSCGGRDCDDGLYTVHPGAREICDGIDNDCDGTADEDAWTLAGESLSLGSPTEEPSSPSLAPGETSWGVAWIADSVTGRAVVAGAIEPGAAGPVATVSVADADGASPQECLVVPSGAGGFLLFAVTSGTTGGNDVLAWDLASDGSLSASAVQVVSFAGAIQDLAVARATDTGSWGLLFRSDMDGDYEIYFITMAWPSAMPATEADAVRLTDASGFSARPSAVGLASGFAIAWEDGRDGNTEIYFAILDGTGTLTGPGRRLTTAPGDSQDAVLAATPDGFGLAWMDSRAGGYDLMFTCLDPGGARVCPEISISDDGPTLAWYPSLGESLIPGQLALSYAGQADAGFDVMLTAVTTGNDAAFIDAGQVVGRGALGVMSTGLADAGESRGVIWISSDEGGTNALRFQQMGCAGE